VQPGTTSHLQLTSLGTTTINKATSLTVTAGQAYKLTSDGTSNWMITSKVQ
jgi:hypothetical protein